MHGGKKGEVNGVNSRRRRWIIPPLSPARFTLQLSMSSRCKVKVFYYNNQTNSFIFCCIIFTSLRQPLRAQVRLRGWQIYMGSLSPWPKSFQLISTRSKPFGTFYNLFLNSTRAGGDAFNDDIFDDVVYFWFLWKEDNMKVNFCFKLTNILYLQCTQPHYCIISRNDYFFGLYHYVVMSVSQEEEIRKKEFFRSFIYLILAKKNLH